MIKDIFNRVSEHQVTAASSQFTFQATMSEDGRSHGKATFSVNARNRAQAWSVFLKEHKSILPYLEELKLISKG